MAAYAGVGDFHCLLSSANLVQPAGLSLSQANNQGAGIAQMYFSSRLHCEPL